MRSMMDLGIDLDDMALEPARRAGVEVLRELKEADLASLADTKLVVAPTVSKLTERHHALARALASGMAPGEAAVLIGYSASRVSILQQSPAFQDLIEVYRKEKDAEYAELSARLLGLSKDAVLELHTRLEDNPDQFANKDLMELAKITADRAGYAPVQRQEVTTFSLSERLAVARARLKAAPMIDITPE